jgi:hypothetical protein
MHTLPQSLFRCVRSAARLGLCLLVLSAGMGAAPAFALVLRVGSDAACTHTSLQTALFALQGQAGLPRC